MFEDIFFFFAVPLTTFSNGMFIYKALSNNRPYRALGASAPEKVV